MLPGLLSHFHYAVVVVLLMLGLFVVVSSPNLVKKVVGINVFQTAVFVLYISLGKVAGGTAPILGEGLETFANPLPHVLILTAIVVGIATTALALALVIRIYGAYGTVEEDEIVRLEREDDAR